MNQYLSEMESVLGLRIPKTYKRYTQEIEAEVQEECNHDSESVYMLNLTLHNNCHEKLVRSEMFFLSSDYSGNYYLVYQEDTEEQVYLLANDTQCIENEGMFLQEFLFDLIPAELNIL